jgi:hypothetical protein
VIGVLGPESREGYVRPDRRQEATMYESVTTGIRRSELLREAADYRRRSGLEAGLVAERRAVRGKGTAVATAVGRLVHLVGPRGKVPARGGTAVPIS